ncbi:MAG: alpha/beta hydrolase [Alphaproteobacteria bacterium]|nr:alpha/beta hydrolase [Alphaproteobacteria bacterium]
MRLALRLLLQSLTPAAAALLLSGCVLSDSLRQNNIFSVWSRPLPPRGVFYVTDREPDGAGFSLSWGGGGAHCGRSLVTIANAGSPAAPDPTLNPIPCDGEAAMAAFAAEVAAAAKPCGRVLIIVHGYNLSFRTALLHGAQAAGDAQWRCATILFNWSSEALFNRYAADIERSGYAVPLMLQLMRALNAAGLTPDLLAHSMGARISLSALSALCAAPHPVAGELILAAADVSADPGDDDFARLLTRNARCARRTTLYASDNDLALIASQSAHGGIARAGANPERALTYISSNPRVEVVDASLATGEISGHAYFVFSYEMLDDLMWLLDGASQDKRAGLGTLTCADWSGGTCAAGSGRYALKVDPARRPGFDHKLLRAILPLLLPLQPN